jgi:two-component system alkaline phosphatase synthesis response regulator PhoP
MPDETILAVDDEEDILELVEYNLVKEGYNVITAATGEAALQSAMDDLPDIILLDLMLPGVDGLEVCRKLKSDVSTSNIPVIMLTAKGSEADVIVGLEMGADDYITKPFSPRILTARVKAVLRRKRALSSDDEDSPIQLSGLAIYPDRHEVLVEGSPVELTATEFRILNHIARKPGRVFTRDQIVDAARGKDYPVTDRSVDVHIVSLRKKLGVFGKCVETVRGVGYRFRESQ